MATPRFLVENFFDPTMFTDATVSANEEATGHEAFRVGTNRRLVSTNHWTPTTANSSAWLKVDLGSGNARSADMIVLDRGHNLDGETVTLETSSDDTNWTQVFQVTMPSTEGDNTSLSAANGVKTEEGAWAKSFTSTSARYWRLTISAMGAGLLPKVVGLYLGESYQPGHHISLPFGFGDRRIAGARENDGYDRQFNIKLPSWSAYDNTVRYHIEELFLRRHPMWLVFDPDYAERMWLAKAEQGSTGFERRSGWGFPQADLRAVELQPELF